MGDEDDAKAVLRAWRTDCDQVVLWPGNGGNGPCVEFIAYTKGDNRLSSDLLARDVLDRIANGQPLPFD